jgi:2-aminoadipate transaminase
VPLGACGVTAGGRGHGPYTPGMKTISFARGVPAPECLPVDDLAECARAVLERDGRRVLNYGPAGGYEPLRERLGERHGVGAGRVLVSNGSLEAFALLARLLLGDAAGRRVLVEGPTYDRPLRILADLGADVVPIPFGDDGLDLDALERELDSRPQPAFLYSIPTFQNPSGRTQPLDGRRALIELAREHELLLLEDDPYALVRFEGEPLPSLFELADGEGVVHTSSFSKVASPGLRVGYVVAPAPLAAKLEELATRTYLAPSFLAQATIWEYLQRGLFEPNLERIRGLLRLRRDAMLEALANAGPAGARWSRPEGGYFVWLELPEGTDTASVLARSEHAGVTFVKGSDFYPSGAGGDGAARLAYSFVSPDEIADGIGRLGVLLAGEKVTAS